MLKVAELHSDVLTGFYAVVAIDMIKTPTSMMIWLSNFWQHSVDTVTGKKSAPMTVLTVVEKLSTPLACELGFVDFLLCCSSVY